MPWRYRRTTEVSFSYSVKLDMEGMGTGMIKINLDGSYLLDSGRGGIGGIF